MNWFKAISSYFKPYLYDLSIVAIFQDEAPYLKEWIEYHLKVGVQHFWLFNNNSSDNYLDILDSFIQKGVVELIEWPSQEKAAYDFFYDVQSPAYTYAINKARGVSEWLAIIDIDEFIVPVKEKTITECLSKRFSKCSGVCVNWQTFGTSYINKLEPMNGSYAFLNKFIYKMKWSHPWNRNFKSIVKPEHVSECPNPHYCHYLPGYYHVNTHYERVDMESSIFIDVMQINHYWTRDEWYFYHKKMPRWTKKGILAQEYLERAALLNEEKDECIQKIK